MHFKMNWIKIFIMFILLAIKSTLLITATSKEFRNTARPIWQRLLEYNPGIVRGIFDQFENIQLHKLENAKRGLDLGLNRGISGTQAGKHLIGLTTAHFADGPGRRRRSE